MLSIKPLFSILGLGAIALMSHCAPSGQDARSDGKAAEDVYQQGLAIVGSNCVSCHSPKGNPEQRIAPPLMALKTHYWESDMEEADFVDGMTAFLMEPSIAHSRMPKAVERFGLMPNLGMSKADYEAVATYLFRSELEKPDWFEAHYQAERKAMLADSDAGDIDYLKSGKDLALATKAVLGKNLLGAIQREGPAEALDFCNERAIALTDSMAAALGADIRRVSDRNRNPDQAANALELAYIAQAKAEIEATGQAAPQMQELDDRMVGYYPIMTNAMCLQCHGDPGKDIAPATLARLETHYPEDQATGYGPNELRGIWVVAMDKPSSNDQRDKLR